MITDNPQTLNRKPNSETSIVVATASVMIYDDVNRKWIPSGTSSGLSRVHIYKNNNNNTYRVVGRKIQDHEVIMNCFVNHLHYL